MKKYFYIILLAGLLFPSKIIKSCEKRINKVFQCSTSISKHIYKITDLDKSSYDVVRQDFFKDEVNVWIIDNHADSSKYYAILDNVIGKTMPISFLSIFNEDGSVYNVSVIKYREQYGGQIKSKRWLKKFENYTDTSDYTIGRNISAISGATISVHSISKGIHKLSIIINSIIESLNEQ